jgi:REP element-mobilizing transposase RayT
MRDRLQRFYGRGHLHFVTFSCYRRRLLLGTQQAGHRFAVEQLVALRKRRSRIIPIDVLGEGEKTEATSKLKTAPLKGTRVRHPP